MEFIRSDQEIAMAGHFAEANKIGREDSLRSPNVLMDPRRYGVLSRHVENLKATALLLRAVQDPFSCPIIPCEKISYEERPKIIKEWLKR